MFQFKLTKKIYLKVEFLQFSSLFPRENEVTLEAYCTKFSPMNMTKFLDILKELGTHFKIRYGKLKSEERPASYRILKKVHK